MKVAINTVCGGYVLPEEFFEAHPDKDRLDYNYYDKTGRTRSDQDVISFIESYGLNGYDDNDGTHIKIVDIPDDATDLRVYDYDGAEWIVYVQDGKLYEATAYLEEE